ncbi:IclR family transcriptional regulator domain-containing protein [Citricoccus parietis]
MDDQSDNGHRDRDIIQSLERGITVLRAFAEVRTRPTIADLASAVGLSRPVVRRIMLTFERLGYAHQYRGEWVLTPRVLEMGQGYFSGESLPEIAQPHLQMVADRTEESTSVSVLDGADVVHVARVEVKRIMPYAVRVGSRLPAHATAMGHVLLGALSADGLEHYFEVAELVDFTPATMSGKAALQDCVAEAREQGYSLSVEELEPGMLAVAVPITVRGRVIATLSSTSTTARTSAEALLRDVVPLLKATAGEIAQDYYLSNRENGVFPRSE